MGKGPHHLLKRLARCDLDNHKQNGAGFCVVRGRHMTKNRCRGGKAQQEARKRTIKRLGMVCQRCGYLADNGLIYLHHTVPLSKGGTHEDANLTLLCESCHAAAHGHGIYKWRDPLNKLWADSGGGG